MKPVAVATVLFLFKQNMKTIHTKVLFINLVIVHTSHAQVM